jgi:hypothetical protein
MLTLHELFPVVLTGIAITAIYAYVQYRHQSRFPARPQTPEALLREHAAKAIDRARSRYGVTLDYSTESVQSVESVLTKIHQTYRSDRRSVDVHSVAAVFGAYIGETIRRNHAKCRWDTGHGTEVLSYRLLWGKRSCSPMEWCFKRVSEGAADNVWLKYLYLHERPEIAAVPQPLTRTTAVGR